MSEDGENRHDLLSVGVGRSGMGLQMQFEENVYVRKDTNSLLVKRLLQGPRLLQSTPDGAIEPTALRLAEDRHVSWPSSISIPPYNTGPLRNSTSMRWIDIHRLHLLKM